METKEYYADSLFLGDLATSADEASIRETFQQFGEIVDIRIKIDATDNKRKLGYGFIQFSAHDAAALALERMNGVLFKGRTLRINWAEKQKPGRKASRQTAAVSTQTVQILISFISKNPQENITEEMLRKVFGKYGVVVDVVIKSSRNDEQGSNKPHTGYAFLHFEHCETGIENAIHLIDSVKRVCVGDMIFDCRMSDSFHRLLYGYGFAPDHGYQGYGSHQNRPQQMQDQQQRFKGREQQRNTYYGPGSDNPPPHPDALSEGQGPYDFHPHQHGEYPHPPTYISSPHHSEFYPNFAATGTTATATPSMYPQYNSPGWGQQLAQPPSATASSVVSPLMPSHLSARVPALTIPPTYNPTLVPQQGAQQPTPEFGEYAQYPTQYQQQYNQHHPQQQQHQQPSPTIVMNHSGVVSPAGYYVPSYMLASPSMTPYNWAQRTPVGQYIEWTQLGQAHAAAVAAATVAAATADAAALHSPIYHQQQQQYHQQQQHQAPTSNGAAATDPRMTLQSRMEQHMLPYRSMSGYAPAAFPASSNRRRFQQRPQQQPPQQYHHQHQQQQWTLPTASSATATTTAAIISGEQSCGEERMGLSTVKGQQASSNMLDDPDATTTATTTAATTAATATTATTATTAFTAAEGIETDPIVFFDHSETHVLHYNKNSNNNNTTPLPPMGNADNVDNTGDAESGAVTQTDAGEITQQAQELQD